MKYAVLATWKMALEGTKKAASLLAAGEHSGKAIVEGVCMVEDEPSFHSVGYGGRPNAEGRVFLDGGYMDGDSLHFGAVGSIENFRSPVRIAYSLQEGEANNFLVGEGAEHEEGVEITVDELVAAALQCGWLKLDRDGDATKSNWSVRKEKIL